VDHVTRDVFEKAKLADRDKSRSARKFTALTLIIIMLRKLDAACVARVQMRAKSRVQLRRKESIQRSRD